MAKRYTARFEEWEVAQDDGSILNKRMWGVWDEAGSYFTIYPESIVENFYGQNLYNVTRKLAKKMNDGMSADEAENELIKKIKEMV